MSLSERVDRREGGVAAAAGAGAYLLGYLITYVTQRGSVEERLQAFNAIAGLFGGDPIPPWQAVAWLFYNAQFVATEIPTLGGTRTQNFIAEGDGSLAALYLVAPLCLLGAGLLVGYLLETEGALGALVVAGYLPLAALGTVVFGYAIGEGVVAPDPITAVLLAGVVYPAVFGTVGGLAGERLRERE